MSYIVTNKWMRSGYGERLRAFFAKEGALKRIIDFGHAPNLTAPNWDVPPAVGLPCVQGSPGDYEGWKALAASAVANGWSLT